MHLLAKLTMGQQRLVQPTGAAAAEILAHQRKRGEHGKSLKRQQHVAACFPLYMGELFKVLL